MRGDRIDRGEARRIGAGADERLLLVLGEQGIERWLLIAGQAVAASGEGTEGMPEPRPPLRAALAVPGADVAIHWLDLEAGLAPAQAAAAARLLIADRIAEETSAVHVAVGGTEAGRTCVGVVAHERMRAWLAAAAAAGVEPDLVLPSSLLIPPVPGATLRHGLDHRGEALAFTLEPELAALLLQAEPRALDPGEWEAGLAAALARPPLNLRHGAYAASRRLRLDAPRLRRLALLALALAALTLAVQVVTILRLTFAADAMEEEAAALSAATSGAAAAGPGWGAVAGALFDAVRSTPNAELSALRYDPDGTVRATVLGDSEATLAALGERLETSGFSVTAGPERSAGGRPARELELRAR